MSDNETAVVAEQKSQTRETAKPQLSTRLWVGVLVASVALFAGLALFGHLDRPESKDYFWLVFVAEIAFLTSMLVLVTRWVATERAKSVGVVVEIVFWVVACLALMAGGIYLLIVWFGSIPSWAAVIIVLLLILVLRGSA